MKFNTKAIHGKISKKDPHGSIKTPIYTGVAFEFDRAEDLEDAFHGRKMAHVYGRISNPSAEAFENKVNALENGLSAVATSSGMSAIANTLFATLKSGDNIVASKFLFGGSYSLLSKTIKQLGIEARFVDITSETEILSAIDSNTKMIFLETIANPQMTIPDIASIGKIAKERGILLVVDSTVTTPYLFNAKEFGVNVVVHSSTKFISGGATSVGGVIVDLGNFDWSKLESLKEYHKYKQWAFISRLRKEVYRDLGACLSPFNAFLQGVGLETLSLRVDRACDNSLAIAKELLAHKNVKRVNYPGLEESKEHRLAKKQFNGKFGAVLTFEVESKEKAFQFLNKLQIIRRATNLGDNTTLALHPASTIFAEYSPAERANFQVSDSLIRLSVGIEDIEDLIDDLTKALEE